MSTYAVPFPRDADLSALRAAVAAAQAARRARRRSGGPATPAYRSGRPVAAGTGPVWTGPAGPGSAATGPAATGSAATGPAATGSAATGSAATGSAGTGSAATGPAATEPAVTWAGAPNGQASAGVGHHPGSPVQPEPPPASVPPEDPDRTAVDEAWRLVAAAQAGDAEAFGSLYDRYVGMVFRYAYHRLGDRALAEDVTSETFLRALRRIGSLSYRGRDVGAWFVTIARNLVLDHLKSGRHRLEVVTADVRDADLRDADRTTEGPEPAVLRQLTNDELLRCVRMLVAEQQECVVLRFLQGLSVAETARIMGKNESAIKALQHRAVRRLASLLPDGLR